jgi:hypothetical protein
MLSQCAVGLPQANDRVSRVGAQAARPHGSYQKLTQIMGAIAFNGAQQKFIVAGDAK